MKKTYNNPEMKVKLFANEKLMTDSGIGNTDGASAESKAAKVLDEAGTTQNVTLKWAL